jgi:hypothetical protein
VYKILRVYALLLMKCREKMCKVKKPQIPIKKLVALCMSFALATYMQMA